MNLDTRKPCLSSFRPGQTQTGLPIDCMHRCAIDLCLCCSPMQEKKMRFFSRRISNWLLKRSIKKHNIVCKRSSEFIWGKRLTHHLVKSSLYRTMRVIQKAIFEQVLFKTHFDVIFQWVQTRCNALVYAENIDFQFDTIKVLSSALWSCHPSGETWCLWN